ncbi:MAG: DUF3370 family protein [Limnoraphis robusta]
MTFKDLENHWTKDCILELAKRNLVSGYPDGTFRPDKDINRAEFAVLMCNIFPDAKVRRQSIKFKDVTEKHWAYNAIKTASEKGFFAGYPDGRFRPEQNITRVQAITVLAAYLQYSSFLFEEHPFDRFFLDSTLIPGYATEYIAKAIQTGIIVNYPDIQEFRPNENTTRGEVAALFCRVLNFAGVPLEYVVGLDIKPMEIRSLPGQLNTLPTFNSNSPELIRTEGILLSTFPPNNKQFPKAHLNFPFTGRFDIFSHHITRAETQSETHPFYQGIILYNPTDNNINVKILAAASYLSTPDAPYINLPEKQENSQGTVYSGPGSRTMNEVLRGNRQDIFPEELILEPKQYKMLMNLPIPVPGFPASNGRSTMIRLSTTGQIYVADLARKASLNADKTYRPPTLSEWIELLNNKGLAEPRDRTPTPLEPQVTLPIVFSRVAGVSQGTEWQAEITDNPESKVLSIPQIGKAFSYVIGTLHKITLGTQQVQSAKMLVRYPDTAFFAHANYGIEYKIGFTLYNQFSQQQTVRIGFSSPLKNDETDALKNQLIFLQHPPEDTFFRGTVRVSYDDLQGGFYMGYFHLIQPRGKQGESIFSRVDLPPASRHRVEINFLYPPDSTPPQVITIESYVF